MYTPPHGHTGKREGSFQLYLQGTAAFSSEAVCGGQEKYPNIQEVQIFMEKIHSVDIKHIHISIHILEIFSSADLTLFDGIIGIIMMFECVQVETLCPS